MNGYLKIEFLTAELGKVIGTGYQKIENGVCVGLFSEDGSPAPEHTESRLVGGMNFVTPPFAEVSERE